MVFLSQTRAITILAHRREERGTFVAIDWAASLRNASVPDIFGELLERTACFVDAPLRQIREFIDTAADQIAHLPELASTATDENPVKVELTLKLDLDREVKERHRRALKQLGKDL